MSKKCCVKGCITRTAYSFKFPQGSTNKTRFFAWLAACGNKDLLDLPLNRLRNRTVCILHFEPKYVLSKKLSTSAIPTLHLPQKIDVSGYKFGDEHFTVTPLSYFDLSKQTSLSPKDKTLYNAIAHLRKTARQAQKPKVSLIGKLKRAEKLLRDGSWDQLMDLPETSQSFLASYFKNTKRSKYHKKTSIHDKVFALALYKRSPRAYNFMQEIFSLPSVKTLRKFLTSIPTRPGICSFLFQATSDKVCRLKNDKSHYCVLIFGKTSLDPALRYTPRTGTVNGLVDTGYQREPKLANHVTVWMLKGVQGDWEQPILYSFCHSTMKWQDIVRTYGDIVREALKFGLIIISSICNQGVINVRAMKYLMERSKRESSDRGEMLCNDIIVIDGQKIVPLFNPSHLLTCVRNNLLSNDVKFTLSDGLKRVARWSHVKTAYAIDKSSNSLRAMKKLTDSHIEEDKIKKKKVKYCTQLFSNTVASVMALMSRSGTQSTDGALVWCMPAAGHDTARFIEFMNNLFDSVNGGTTHKAMTSTTASDDDWNSCMSVLRTMSYVKSKPGDVEISIVLKNWLHTLHGFKYLKKYLKELGFKDFDTRVFNHDALEIFFHRIRRHGTRGTKMNCLSFQTYYKRLLLKSFSESDRGFDFESDESSNFLVDLKNIMTAPAVEKEFVLPPNSTRLLVIPHKRFQTEIQLFKQSIRRFVKNCQTCQANVFGKSVIDGSGTSHSPFDDGFSKMAGIMTFYISQFVHIEGFGKVIVGDLCKKDYFAFIRCDHASELLYLIISKYVASTTIQYLKMVTGILSGSDSPEPDSEDTLVLQAYKLNKNRACCRPIKTE